MASSGNTWQKKLMNKQRLYALKVNGVKPRFAVETIAKPTPKEDKRAPLPMKPSWAPRPYGKLNRRRLA